MKSRMMTLTIRGVRIGEWVIVTTLSAGGRDVTPGSTRRGYSEIKRAAIVAESGRTERPGSRAAISEANFQVAAELSGHRFSTRYLRHLTT